MSQFDGYIKRVKELFLKSYSDEDWALYVNYCASITAFVGAFPEKSRSFKELIVPLIKVMGDKIDVIRKNSAILLAKLVKDEECMKIMKANHGTEVLVSLQNQLTS